MTAILNKDFFERVSGAELAIVRHELRSFAPSFSSNLSGILFNGYWKFLRNASRVGYSIDSQPPHFANDGIYVGYEVIGVVIYLNFGDVRQDLDPVCVFSIDVAATYGLPLLVC